MLNTNTRVHVSNIIAAMGLWAFLAICALRFLGFDLGPHPKNAIQQRGLATNFEILMTQAALFRAQKALLAAYAAV